jgi:hypothetical protein
MMEVKTIIAATLISTYFQYSIPPKGRIERGTNLEAYHVYGIYGKWGIGERMSSHRF